MNPYEEWNYHITRHPEDVLAKFEKDRPKSVGFDTETTGLHIKKDTPFLFQLGWGRVVYLFDPTNRKMMDVFFQIARQVKYVFAHNCGYDLNMICNLGYSPRDLEGIQWCDSQSVMRLILEAVSVREGGDNLKLKDLGVKYIHPYASNSETLIKEAMTELKKERNRFLAAVLKQFPHPTEKKLKYFRKATGKGTTAKWALENPEDSVAKWMPANWTLKHIEDFLKDPTHDLDDLPEEIREVWEEWQEVYPEPTYKDIDRKLMEQYAGEDIATMMMLMERAFPVLMERKQLPILKREMACILPTLRMEREGMKADLGYLELSRMKVKNYIIRLRKELTERLGEEVTVGQHERLKQLFDEKWGIFLEKCDNQQLTLLQKNFDGEIQRVAQLISTLRTAEKWYSTYIKRIQKNAEYDGRVYTQINLSGAISGRMSSDFQQFPKYSLKDMDTGEELYHPRSAFVVDGRDYPELTFMDYDQIELVTQAHYTIRTSGGDLNLCRAYMPFKCRYRNTEIVYDPFNPKHKERYDDKDDDGNSMWIDENGNPWIPSDLHSMTTMKAYPEIDPKSPDFKSNYRQKGKMTNFASNYGIGVGALAEQLGVSYEEAERLLNGYKEAFPHVIIYQDKIQKAHGMKGYVQNHYGRRYYLQDSRKAYRLANYVVQGSCADALKESIVRLDTFLKDTRSCIVMPIHDELIFKFHKDEQHLKEQVLKIMQDAFDWCIVPVTAGIEETTTTWKEKR